MPRVADEGRSATPRRTSGAPTGLKPEKHPTTAAFHVTIRGVELGRGDVSLRTTIYTFLVNELYNSLTTLYFTLGYSALGK